MLTFERNKAITAVLNCADRVIFHGHLTRYAAPKGPIALAAKLGLMLCALVGLLNQWRDLLCRHAEAVAKRSHRPILRLGSGQRKEDVVKQLLAKNPVRSGLVCVVITQEAFWSFRFAGKKERPAVVPDRRFGRTLYYYFLHPRLGLMHVRINTFLPFTIQVYVNGHEWLARELKRERIRFTKNDNAFTMIRNIERAQRIADRFTRLDWIALLDGLALRVNPLLADPLRGDRYYWCVDQFEYATDCLFRSTSDLQPLWERLRAAAMLALHGEDIMAFFGRRPNVSHFEVLADHRQRYSGYRVKHKVDRNWIKVYDKAGSVLRVETTINNPRAFKLYRRDKKDWYQARKSVCDFPQLEEIARRANHRYLEALAAIDPPADSGRALLRLQYPIVVRRRRHAGLKPLDDETIRLFAAVMDGRVHIRGLTNSQIRAALYDTPARDPREERRRAARLTRQLAKLRAHGLVKKIPATHRWAPTSHGITLMTQAIALRNSFWPHALPTAA